MSDERNPFEDFINGQLDTGALDDIDITKMLTFVDKLLSIAGKMPLSELSVVVAAEFTGALIAMREGVDPARVPESGELGESVFEKIRAGDTELNTFTWTLARMFTAGMAYKVMVDDAREDQQEEGHHD